MAIAHINIKTHQFTFVFRHRFEKYDDKIDQLKSNMDWRGWELGIWFRRTKIVGKKNFSKPKEWGNNLVPSYMFGIKLLICKAWIEYNKGGMSIKI